MELLRLWWLWVGGVLHGRLLVVVLRSNELRVPFDCANVREVQTEQGFSESAGQRELDHDPGRCETADQLKNLRERNDTPVLRDHVSKVKLLRLLDPIEQEQYAEDCEGDPDRRHVE